jgi:hypothetical protein
VYPSRVLEDNSKGHIRYSDCILHLNMGRWSMGTMSENAYEFDFEENWHFDKSTFLSWSCIPFYSTRRNITFSWILFQYSTIEHVHSCRSVYQWHTLNAVYFLENLVWCIFGENSKRGFYKEYKYLNSQGIYEHANWKKFPNGNRWFAWSRIHNIQLIAKCIIYLKKWGELCRHCSIQTVAVPTGIELREVLTSFLFAYVL